ncbi:MAG: hypothetical protein ICV51_19100 [Flavisolibacter sp.]|nr:hypothetical protein [Flavisolibacter sp.]
MKTFFVILFFIAWCTGVAQTVAIHNPGEVIHVARYSYYLEDPSGKHTIEDVLKSGAAGEFKKLNKPLVNFSVTASAFWIKCSIRNETAEKLLLELGNTTLYDIRLYEFDSGRLVAQHQAGTRFPFHQREVNDMRYRFELAAPPGATETLLLRVQNYRGTQFPLVVGTKVAFYNKGNSQYFLRGIYYGFMLLMVLYNLFIYFTLRDSSYIYYVLYVFFMGLWNASIDGYTFKYLWPSVPFLNQYTDVLVVFVSMAIISFATNFLNTRQGAPVLHKLLLGLLLCYTITLLIIVSGSFVTGTILLEFVSLISVLVLFVTAYVTLRRGYKPARFFLIAWSLFLVSVVIYVIKDYNIIPYTSLTVNSLRIGSAAEAMLLSMALAHRINIYKEEKEQANMERLLSLEENKKLVEQQNIVLERKVEERTQELKKTNRDLVSVLDNLKATQNQLVQTEKLASLGQLTAGIAHEIKNPLNFINNFSDVNTDLINEMKKALEGGNASEALMLAGTITENNQKIMHHGQRADAIVKNMLEHSRTGKAEKQAIDINALVEEYLRLSYHGFRAKDKDFNVRLQTDFDASIGEIAIIQQDISRVLLNLFNNAFYAVNEKKKQGKAGYEPTVSVSTKKSGNWIAIHVRDNGLGIPQKLLDKLYQPFFTTKPSGQGTCLGLSLSYDIITKGHGGELKVETKEGEYTEFTVLLPV